MMIHYGINISNEESLIIFKLDSMGVVIALQSNILNPFRISIEYFPFPRNIPSTIYHTSTPKK